MPAPALLNELLDKAILEVVVLENAANATRDLIEEIVALGDRVAHTATGKGEKAQGALSTLAQATNHLQDQIHTLVSTRTLDALHGVVSESAKVTEHAQALSTQARGRAADLEQQRTRLEQELEANRKQAREGFEHVRQTVQALGAAVTQQAAAAHTAIDTLRQGVSDARAALAAAKDHFLHALDAAAEAAANETDHYQDAIHAMLNSQTEGLIGLANNMVDAHNIAVVDVRQRLVEELPAEIWRAVGSLHDNIDELKAVAENADEPLAHEVHAVESVVKQAREVLSDLRAFAEKAKEL